MNKKYAIVSIVLIALMSLALVPMQAKAFLTPCGTDDSKYETFGPRPSTLLIKIYTGGYTAEIADLKAKGIDIEDWPLSPSDYQYFATTDPNHLQWSTALTSEYGLYEYDLNDQVMPTNIIAFRQGMSELVDKAYFISLYLAGAAAPADSPIACTTAFGPPGPPPTGISNLYNLQPRTTMVPFPDDSQDMLAAYNYFVATGLPIVADAPSDGYAHGNFMLNWTSPYPNPGPAPNSIPAAANGHLIVFARSDSSNARLQQGYYLKQLLEQSLPDWAAANGKTPFHIYCDLYPKPRAVTSNEVMAIYRYHVYTGGWSLGALPDFLQFYTTAYIGKPAPNAHNYGAYSNPNYDNEVDLMLTSLSPTPASTPCTGNYHAYQAQYIMMHDAALIPMWYAIAYKAALSNWANVINAAGVGLNNWFTFLDMYKIGGTGCGDTVRYGFQSDIQNGNPIVATWYWDWEVIGKVYDTLLGGNPYDPTQLLPALADNWTLGTVAGKTVVTFHLRNDVWWQDVPSKDRSAYTADGSHKLDGPFVNYPLTVLDIAQSFEYIRDMDVWSVTQSGYLSANLDHVAISPIWNSTDYWPYSNAGTTSTPWYNSTYIVANGGNPWQTNYVTFDPTIDTSTIKLYLADSMTWLALFHFGGIPILPYHIFRYIATGPWKYNGATTPTVDLMDLSPNGADLTYGTGPYILLDHVAGDHITMIAYNTGATYRGITEQNSYFWAPVRSQDMLNSGHASTAVMSKPSGATLNIQFMNWLVCYLPPPVTINVTFTYTVRFYPSLTTVSGSVGMTFLQTTRPQYTLAFASALVAIPGGTTWIFVHTDKHIIIHWDKSTTVNEGSFDSLGRPMLDPGQWPGTPLASSPYMAINMAALGADMAGGAMAAPYYGADGSVGTKDLHILGVNWGGSSVGAAPFSDVARADINGDGTVGTKDLHILGVQWGGAWSTTAPEPVLSSPLV